MKFTAFEDRHDASAYAAAEIASALRATLARQLRAAIVVSGGSTPQACFKVLRNFNLRWDRVLITLSDERLVPETDPMSNTRMLRETLLTGSAACARLVPYHTSSDLKLPLPFAATLLGMGEDGHFASWFPTAANLDTGLDLDGKRSHMNVELPEADLPRASLTLPWLIDTNRLLLLVFGETKRQIVAAPEGLPVAALLNQTRTPVEVVWAP